MSVSWADVPKSVGSVEDRSAWADGWNAAASWIKHEIESNPKVSAKLITAFAVDRLPRDLALPAGDL